MFIRWLREVASSIFYDKDNNPACDLESDNVQDAIDELCINTSLSASPGYAFGRSGNRVANDWLNIYGQIRSNRTGIPFGLNNGRIIEIWAGNEDINTFDITIYEHQGDSVGLTSLTTVLADRDFITLECNKANIYIGFSNAVTTSANYFIKLRKGNFVAIDLGPDIQIWAISGNASVGSDDILLGQFK